MADRKTEFFERKDAEEQIAAEKTLGEYQAAGTRSQFQEKMKREVELQNTVQKLESDAQNTMEELQQMDRSEEAAHLQALEQARKKGREVGDRLAEHTDGLTKEALEAVNAKRQELEELDLNMLIQINQAKEKNKEQEVKMIGAVFDEKTARQEKNEFSAEQRQKELENKSAEIRSVELAGIQTQRDQQNETNLKLVAIRREDAQITQRLAALNLTMQRNACDRDNRAFINKKQASIRNQLEDLVGFYENSYGMLSLTPEQYGKLKAMRLKNLRKALTRFVEVLRNIADDFGCIEQKLASLELKDVDKADEIRVIRKKISDFSEVMSYLQTMVLIEEKNIDQEKVATFTNLKNELYEMINKIQPIPEGKTQIVENIAQLQHSTDENKGTDERLRIAN